MIIRSTKINNGEEIINVRTVRISDNEICLYSTSTMQVYHLDYIDFDLSCTAEKNTSVSLIAFEDGRTVANIPADTKYIYKCLSAKNNFKNHCRVGASSIDIDVSASGDGAMSILTVMEDVWLPNPEYKNGSLRTKGALLKKHKTMTGEVNLVPADDLDLQSISSEMTKIVYMHTSQNLEYIFSEVSLA